MAKGKEEEKSYNNKSIKTKTLDGWSFKLKRRSKCWVKSDQMTLRHFGYSAHWKRTYKIGLECTSHDPGIVSITVKDNTLSPPDKPPTHSPPTTGLGCLWTITHQRKSVTHGRNQNLSLQCQWLGRMRAGNGARLQAWLTYLQNQETSSTKRN